jgi:hypothetical protein
MSTTVFAVHTNAVEGREDEFNDWYDNQHIPDVLAVPGFIRARRYNFTDNLATPLSKFKYFAIYEIEGDPVAALAALDKALADGMFLSSAMSTDLYATVYQPITDWRVAETAEKPTDAVSG